MVALFACGTNALADPLVFQGTEGLGKGKHIVFLAGDPYVKYSFSYKNKDYEFGLGHQVLRQTWGALRHKSQIKHAD